MNPEKATFFEGEYCEYLPNEQDDHRLVSCNLLVLIDCISQGISTQTPEKIEPPTIFKKGLSTVHKIELPYYSTRVRTRKKLWERALRGILCF